MDRGITSIMDTYSCANRYHRLYVCIQYKQYNTYLYLYRICFDGKS